MNEIKPSTTYISPQSVASNTLVAQSRQKFIVCTVTTIALFLLFVVFQKLVLGAGLLLAAKVTYNSLQNYRFRTIEAYLNREIDVDEGRLKQQEEQLKRQEEHFNAMADALVLNPRFDFWLKIFLKPEYQSREAINKSAGSVNANKAKPVKTFLAQNPDDPFRKKVIERVADYANYNVTDETYRTIYFPNDAALQMQAVKYCKKYKIIIVVTPDKDLIHHNKPFDDAAFIEKLRKEISEPIYIGMIGHEWNSDHVIPMLLYFDGKNRENDEVVFLDSVGKDYGYEKVFTEKCKIRQTNVFYSSNITQADSLSCRTGAMTLLRNALLSIKFHKRTNGFREALQAGVLLENNIQEMPAEWDYTEQIPTSKHANALVIRNMYSSKPEKSKREETVEAFRKRHTKPVQFTYNLWRNYMWNDKDHFDGVPVPAGVQANFNGCTDITFRNTLDVNVYLTEKGRRNKEQFEKESLVT